MAELYEPSICNQENSDFFRLLEENTGIRQKTYSKLDESSIVGENCKVILKNPVNEATPLMKKQQKKYYKAFMIMQALFISAKESTERKVSSLNTQIAEVNQMIKENKEFKNRLETAIYSKMEVLKEELMQKFAQDANKLIEKYQNRDTAHKAQTKNKIISLRKEIDVSNDKVFKSFDESRAKNSEDLLRKNCEMRLKIALMQAEAQNFDEIR